MEPYWGKPAVRNLRGDDGNVGIKPGPRHRPTRLDDGLRRSDDDWDEDARAAAASCLMMLTGIPDAIAAALEQLEPVPAPEQNGIAEEANDEPAEEASRKVRRRRAAAS